ncbi:MAG TPA: aromatic ring-hydroxylating dioxygenase subunit alpha [Bordetella sp.]
MTSYTAESLGALVQDGGARINGRIYTDPEIFELEMDKIFSKVWVYVGHESQVPNPGDYITGLLARQPIILTRGKNGKTHVLFNRCTHRGAKIVNQDAGNEKVLACMYHGWAFEMDGSLRGIPMKKDFPAAAVEDGKASLGKPPRVESYRGFIFASLNADVEPLLDFLGAAASGIDEIVDRAPAGTIRLSGGYHRYVFPGNWKLQMENLADMYHPVACHISTVGADGKQFKRRPGEEGGRAAFLGPDGEPLVIQTGVRGFSHGHSSEASLFGSNDMSQEAKQRGGVFDEYRSLLVRLHGAEKTDDVLKNRRHSMTLFPTLDILMVQTSVRVVIPLAYDRTEVRIYPVHLDGAPDELNRQIIKFINITHSAASFIQTDDLEAFKRQQEGMAAQSPEWMNVSRGQGGEIDEGRGTFFGPRASEVGQRMRHQYWRELMVAE